MMENKRPAGIQVDESTHQEVPTTKERLTHAALAAILGFLLLQLIGFWVFPGIGWYGGLSVFSYLPELSFVGPSFRIYAYGWLIICAAAGWLRGPYFINSLKDYILFWKFW